MFCLQRYEKIRIIVHFQAKKTKNPQQDRRGYEVLS